MRNQADYDRIVARRAEQLAADMEVSKLMEASLSEKVRMRMERYELEDQLPPGLAMWSSTQKLDLGMLKTRVEAYRALKAGTKLPGIALPLP